MRPIAKKCLFHSESNYMGGNIQSFLNNGLAGLVCTIALLTVIASSGGRSAVRECKGVPWGLGECRRGGIGSRRKGVDRRIGPESR